jgi:hypothetical protein
MFTRLEGQRFVRWGSYDELFAEFWKVLLNDRRVIEVEFALLHETEHSNGGDELCATC